MPTLFDGEIEVDYGFVDVVADGDESPDLVRARGGQRNGLCGAACANALSLVTATRTGAVPLRVELHDAPPPLDPAWEDVVEVSFVATSPDLVLRSFQDMVELAPLPAVGDHRVRYSATSMDEAHDRSRLPDDPVVDRYLLQLWPAPPGPDAVLRSTSAQAGYWHGVAAETPPPPSPRQRAAAAAAEAEQERLRREEAEDRWQRRLWGGRLATPQLLGLGSAAQLAHRDRDLVDAVLDAPGPTQRTLTVWAVGRAYEVADARAAAVLAPAVVALRAGTAVPPPFDDPATAWDALFPGPSTVTVTVVRGLPSAAGIDAGAAALSAVLAAQEAAPAAAAAGALAAAASGPLGDLVLDEARSLLGLPPAGVRARLW
ncbi:hypothetical protein [Cellulomonas xiejunii]|uniref:Uncharacterized protein n=1 Tax=Cellulomonas xiejunii TaxID=2968083 RepID=A0ABY5KUH1_9CELL|nr:hypothetical protein [Cellulomonas xiejunii]MCC2321397.1 hypothetical protein [Cellulomonas xiejunii]UUI71978.1 hypothetical protein NP048_00435 [Cellulomonas xiejunii]